MSVIVSRKRGRPSATENFLIDWAVNLAQSLQQSQIELDFVASGDSLSNYEVEIIKPNRINLLMARYLGASIFGREPGTFPPLAAIVNWIKVKGITPDGISINSLAFLIGRKMKEEGNAVYRGDREGIPYLELLEESFKDIEDDAALLVAIEAANKLTRSIAPKRVRND